MEKIKLLKYFHLIAFSSKEMCGKRAISFYTFLIMTSCYMSVLLRVSSASANAFLFSNHCRRKRCYVC